jgi:predicted metalloprotease with PDZ domain
MIDARGASRAVRISALLAGLVFGAAAQPVSARIAYRVSLANPDQHLFHVDMTVPVEGREVITAMPAWNALYQVRDFSFRLHAVSGICPASIAVPLAIHMLDKQTWRVSLDGPCQPGDHNSFEIRYSVEWDDPGPFDSQLNLHHAFVNLAEILLYVPDRRAEGASVIFADLPAGWRTVAELAAAHGDNEYTAPSYDALVDAPVEAGEFDEFQFTESGVGFRVVVDASAWDRSSLEEALHRITRYEMKLMGGAPPFDLPSPGYTFFFHIGPYEHEGGGGMEHRNSAAIGATSVESAVEIAAHEFFHVWNVKRIRPRALEPVDYSKEQYTRALWFAEGVTSSYAAFTLERTELWSKKQFYDDLALQIGELQSRPAHKWQSVEDSSLDAWLEKYDSYNAPDRSISYYNKGQIVGVLLDLSIRDATDNRKSLDDVLRRMNDEYARAGNFYDDSDGIRAVVEEVSGKRFEDFFSRYISGTAEIPYNDFLALAGLELNESPAQRPDQRGGQGDAHLSVSEIAHPSERQRRIREGLLRGATN